MVSFCDCETCKKIKKKIMNPECGYCGEHHDPRVHCIEEIKQRTKDNSFRNIQNIPRYTEEIYNEMTFKKSTKPELEDKVCPACHTRHDKGRIGCPDIDEVKSIIKDDSEYFIDVCDGKYTVYQEKGGSLKALRYGEPWQDLVGNNLVFYLMIELIEAKEKLKALQFMVDQNMCLEVTFLSINSVNDILKGED